MTGSPRTLLHVFPSFAVGGAQMRFAQLANHFGPAYRHRVVSMNGGKEAVALLAGDLDVRLLEVPVVRGQTWPNLKAFRRLLKDQRPDLLVTSNWGSIEWAMANYDGLVPHLHMEDGFGPEETDRQLPRRVWTRRLVLRRAKIMLPSMTLFGIARDLWRLPKRHLLHIPNGVDCARFGLEGDLHFATSLGLQTQEPSVGTVATLRAEKNLVRLLEAFAEVIRRRPARLVIVGDGAELTGLRNRAAELGLADRVVFTGACAKPEKLLPFFDVFALSSDTEQMPLSILEAMSVGRPVAATDVGDVRNMLAEENHPFVVARNSAALAEAILALLDNPIQAQGVGAANALRARKVFDQSLMFAAYRKLFDGTAPG